MAVLDEFLASIAKFLRARDDNQLRLFLRVEPPLPHHFIQLGNELRASFGESDALESHIHRFIPDTDAEEPGVWPGFLFFLRIYLEYWRDVNFDDLLETHAQLSSLVTACVTALSNTTFGIVMLPTTIQLSSTLARLAMTLDKRPDLTRTLRKVANVDQGETRKSLVESTAEIIQKAFTICLTDRTSNKSGIGADGKPEGKKIGIYSFTNLVLMLLFRCRKTQLANQLFTNIHQMSPPLARYPASQRVTYLFYLGRFQFFNNHFFSAQLSLQAAYDQCHAKCLNQRRNILIYLISSNLILGRYPSKAFMSRPEINGIIQRFAPIFKAMRKGDLAAFKRALGPESGNAEWLFKKNIYLPVLSRCEVIVWRSLARRVFLLTYKPPTDPNSKKAPTMDLVDILAAAQYCQKSIEGWQKPVDNMTTMQSGRTHPNAMFMKPTDLVPPPGGTRKLGPYEGVIYGNKMPDLLNVEGMMASLVNQGLLHGFISHNQGKFAIIGAKQRGGPFNAGFPSVWEVMSSKAKREGRATEVPGWVQSEIRGGMGGVVNLTGIARAVGSGG